MLLKYTKTYEKYDISYFDEKYIFDNILGLVNFDRHD